MNCFYLSFSYQSICDLIFFVFFTFGGRHHFELMVIYTSQELNKTYVPYWGLYIKHKFVLNQQFLQFFDRMKGKFKNIDRRKSAEITTLCIISDLIGPFWRDILQREDGESNFASRKKVFAEEFSHTTVSF